MNLSCRDRRTPWTMLIIAFGMSFVNSTTGASVEQVFDAEVQPLLRRYCHECHADDVTEAEIDLSAFASLAVARGQPKVWQKVREMLESSQMPPKDSAQPSDTERQQLQNWLRAFLMAEARATAGDPGPVVLRRLTNAEYNYTMEDLTGVALDPTREFPVDGAAGEGFTNTGSAQGMSPALVTKYLDAAKSVAEHAALFPAGIRFTSHTSRRDLTDDLLGQLRAFYAQFTTDGGGASVNLQGIKFDTNQGGLLPLGEYLTASVVERHALLDGRKTLSNVAHTRKLSPKYLRLLWRALTDAESPSLLLDPIRERWREAKPEDVESLIMEIATWQKQLWKFNVVGHVGREGAPRAWLESVTPVVSHQEFRIKLPESAVNDDVVVYLSSSAAGAGDGNDYVLWRDMRLEGNGQPALPLRDVQGLHDRLLELRRDLLRQTPDYLAAVAEASADVDVASLAEKHSLQQPLLRKWLDYLNINVGGPVTVQGHFRKQLLKGAGYDFINGWGSDATPSVIANASDQEVRIPGLAKPHSLVAHPSPTLFAAIGWSSPIDGVVQVDASISDAHPECGNGVKWFVQHRTSSHVTNLGQGDIGTRGTATMPPQKIAVRTGDLLSLIVDPKGDYGCDLTAIDLTITEVGDEQRVWNAAHDTSGNILDSNPHADRYENPGTWHFYQGALAEVNSNHGAAIRVPPDSLLAKWQGETDAELRKTLAQQIAELATAAPPTGEQKATPDGILYAHLQSLVVLLDDKEIMSGAKRDPRFGQHPRGHAIDPNHLVAKAPSTVEFRIPSELAADREVVIVGTCDVGPGREGALQLHVSLTPRTAVPSTQPIVCAEDSATRKRVEQACAEFGELFPIALCYTRIVPVDEVVTATLFHREDELLKRLMLDESQAAELERLWDELYFVSEEPLKLVVSLEQIREFSTQDRQDLVGPWDKLKPVVQARADAFQQKVISTEPIHVESVLTFANRAWRRALSADERQDLRDLYGKLRSEDLSHEQSIRLVVARVLASPAFLYRREEQPEGTTAVPVSNLELANRLSYFLWSSMPDGELRAAAEAGRLISQVDPNGELLQQTRRMLKHPRTGRLVIQFACQWLHVRDFNHNEEKNEKLYPEFSRLRGDMYAETVRFFDDMFRNDGSILDMFNADHTFLNAALAEHYQIADVVGSQWRRVDGVQSKGRGGLLGMATVLASQSGASRTSPILRGNWVSETLLGERLPRPPANVPVLPEAVPAGLTSRQLIERHSSVPECAKCHRRIDPYGFALEQFDAIGRTRGDEVDTTTTLVDGKKIDGLDGLRNYLVNDRRDEVVRHFRRKLLGYALGREVQLSDEVLLAEMQEQLAAHGFRFSVAVEAIVTSEQFQGIRAKSFNPQ